MLSFFVDICLTGLQIMCDKTRKTIKNTNIFAIGLPFFYHVTPIFMRDNRSKLEVLALKFA